jgi:hypothetical protein
LIEELPRWFKGHADTYDAALAGFLQQQHTAVSRASA